MRLTCQRWRWWLLVAMLVVSPHALLAGCVDLLRPELAGWWEVEFASDEWGATPAGSQLVSLLNIGGCSSEPELFVGQLISSSPNNRVLLDWTVTIQEHLICYIGESGEVECEHFEPVQSAGETRDVMASESGLVMPGSFLGFQDPIVVADSGETELELHSLTAVDPDIISGPEPYFSADDTLTLVRVHWERTVTWQPPDWTTSRGEMIRESHVVYTLLDDIPAGLFAYPSDLLASPPLWQTPVVTEAHPAGTTLELRRRLNLVFTRLDG